MEKGLCHATDKVYAAAVSSCHESFGYRPVSAPQWNVPVVHEALVSDPYEPLERSSLKALSFKTALLLALTSAMRVSEVCALSVHPSCFVVTTAGLLSDRLTDFYNYQIYSF